MSKTEARTEKSPNVTRNSQGKLWNPGWLLNEPNAVANTPALPHLPFTLLTPQQLLSGAKQRLATPHGKGN